LLLASQQLVILTIPSDHSPVTVVHTRSPVAIAIWTGAIESTQLTGRIVAIAILPQLNKIILSSLTPETAILNGFSVDLAILIKARDPVHQPDRREITNDQEQSNSE